MPGTDSPADHRGRSIDFGRTADDYEQHRPGFPESFFDRLERAQWVVPGQRVLDLGTGTGSLALGCARRDLVATGLDPSPDLLEVARRPAADDHLAARFVVGTAERTGLPGAAFDVVTAGQCWWWFNADEALREIRRVLVAAGRLIIANFSYLPLGGTVAGRTEELILDHNPDWPKAGWSGVHPEQVTDLIDGGFVDVESLSYDLDVSFTHAQWRGRIRTCNGVGAALDAGSVARFDGELAALLASDFQGTLTVPHRIFVATGVTR